ncbi:hypothetical protein Patl1_25001 [Pistacia atlantica]|uniref:Uncharacterized protein n=1 Tax=Pistacia atlantica TaxID=434234 RepID=A0ACC1B0B1_9ROSI|nr:hypothetical protein Patl1_25001 [Pistacia atlantica]
MSITSLLLISAKVPKLSLC